MVDLMCYLMGDAVSVYSRQENLFHRDVPDYSVEDVSATVFGFQGGGIGVIYATNGAIPGKWINDYRLVAQKLTAEFANANNAVFHFTAETPVRSETLTSEKNIHLAEIQDLLTAIRSDGQTRTPMRAGAKSLDMALAATQSAQTHKEISLVEPLAFH
jgi:predicted dehydrogenase